MKSKKVLESLNKLTYAKPSNPGILFLFKKILQKVRSFIAKIWDPVITINIGGENIMMPLSHRFPNFISEWPLYDTVLPRLCQFIFIENKNLRLIDVGANIGETVCLVNAKVDGKYLCIEPSQKYFKILEKNTKNNKNITVDNHLIGEFTGDVRGEIKNSGGTASVKDVKESKTKIITLDDLINQYFKDFINSNIIKIDTDGYDFKVLRGAKNLMQKSKPILFFELAPEELVGNGKEDPYSIFPFLKNLGYQQFLIYDNEGFLISAFNKADDDTLTGLVDYVWNKSVKGFWTDVIAFHNDVYVEFKKFYELEKQTLKEVVSDMPTLTKKFIKLRSLLFKKYR